MTMITDANRKLLEQLPVEVRPIFSEIALFSSCDEQGFKEKIEQNIADFKEPLAILEKRAFDEGFKAAMDYYGIIPS